MLSKSFIRNHIKKSLYEVNWLNSAMFSTFKVEFGVNIGALVA